MFPVVWGHTEFAHCYIIVLLSMSGTWSEQQVFWNRVAKSWQEYFKSQSTVTHARSAPARTNREPADPDKTSKDSKPRQPRRRNKQKAGPNPKKADERKNSGLEDFKFETPPITPPPDQGDKIPIASSSAKRDEEFWNFYEKGQ